MFAQTDLYPNAALKMMTQTTTAFGVCGTSMYIQYPVATSAVLICHLKSLSYISFNFCSRTYHDRPRKQNCAPSPTINKIPAIQAKIQQVVPSKKSGYARRKSTQDIYYGINSSHQNRLASYPTSLCKKNICTESKYEK